jgi:hypothetical protein
MVVQIYSVREKIEAWRSGSYRESEERLIWGLGEDRHWQVSLVTAAFVASLYIRKKQC